MNIGMSDNLAYDLIARFRAAVLACGTSASSKEISDYMRAQLVLFQALRGVVPEVIDEMCARIKAADDAAAGNDYMLDSDDCIAVLRGTWGGPMANDHPQPQIAVAVAVEPAEELSFQDRMRPWLIACFGEKIAADGDERNHRFLEESLELVQACGCTASEAHQLVDYVFARPVGEKAQEAGGVMTTLAALCIAQGLDMQAAGEAELARIWTKVDQIRAKQAAKPQHSPLPEHVQQPHPQLLAQLRKERDGWMQETGRLREAALLQRDQLELRALHQANDCWYWQGDSEDHPESFGNSMCIVIRGDQLRELVDKANAGPAPELVRAAEKALKAMIAGKRVLKRVGYSLDRGTIGGPFADAVTGLRAVLDKTQGAA